jgi:hypothetical protein
MRVKTLVIFRSNSTHLQEMAAAAPQIPCPETVQDPLVMIEEKIQALVDRRLLRSKVEGGVEGAHR